MTQLTYAQQIDACLLKLAYSKTDRASFIAAAAKQAKLQKLDITLIYQGVMQAVGKALTDWQAYFDGEIFNEHTPVYGNVAGLRSIYTPPVKKEYQWDFKSNSLTRENTLILPTKHKVPEVYFTPQTRAIIDHLVRACNQEVGWLGTVAEDNGVYVIDQIFVPKQTVTHTETDIGLDAMGALAEELFEKGDSPDRLYYWGHSHVNMGVSPSSQDEDQIREYLEACPKFIRSIHNKAGLQKVDFYDRDNRIIYQNLPAKTLFSLEQTFKTNLDELIARNVTAATFNYNMGNTKAGKKKLPQI